MPKAEFLKSEDELTIYKEEEYTRFFAEFEQGIKKIEALEKRLKRKKIKFDKEKNIDFFITHLKSQEIKYFEVLRELFENDEESEDEDERTNRVLIQKDLSFYIHNKYAVMNYLLEWEFEKEEEQRK